ncbi:hypothetical protein Srot_1774 [Segniliparus rotundus DSM 44985]|uniref:Uncharacterized protein n=1 Tax=Segniliparus rotundus (strain ATCC BAA-972 / CDC 1076 / CIP 108378 / DSM 44985 / JCM 13578) TaxID=640132 RepID=D6Z8F4_SEGRD|nr:hypothetical protein Srot_1774 [Segniliparus rotundus DSM 44985]
MSTFFHGTLVAYADWRGRGVLSVGSAFGVWPILSRNAPRSNSSLRHTEEAAQESLRLLIRPAESSHADAGPAFGPKLAGAAQRCQGNAKLCPSTARS